MRKFISTTALIIFVVILLPKHAFSEVIFQEDFESFPSDWNCSVVSGKFGANPGDFGQWQSPNCRTATGAGYNVRIGPGFNGGQGLQNTFNSNTLNDYNLISSSETLGYPTWTVPRTEIYNRWYMKVDTALDKSINQAGSLKFWRFYTPDNISEIYLHVSGLTFRGGVLRLLSTEWNPVRHWDLAPVTSVADGNWHSLELRIKLNSTGVRGVGESSDGEADFWIDGISVASYRNQNFSPTATPLFGAWAHVGVGNVSDEPWDNATAAAFYFDNVILSTTYNGPLNKGSPSPPQNLQIK